MPVPMIKSFAKESGKSEEEVEKLYAKAKEEVKEGYNITEDDDQFYPLVTGVLKKMCGISDGAIHICEKCSTILDSSGLFCSGCGSQFDAVGSAATIRITRGDVDALSSFLYIMLRKRIVFKDLMRHIRRIANVHGIKTKNDSYDLSGKLSGSSGKELMRKYFNAKE